MRHILLSFLIIFAFVGYEAPLAGATLPAKEGSVVIQKRKVVLVRPGKLVRGFPERKRAVIYYPEVSGLSSPAVLNKVRSTLRLKNLFDTSLAEYKADTWLSELDYEVNYNKNFILDITFSQSGIAAYPDTHTRHFTINLKTGHPLKALDVFKPSSLNALARMVDAKLQAETREIIKTTEQDSSTTEEDRQNNADLFGALKFTPENLDEFSVGDKGVTFLYDAGFPHVIQALEPDGKYFFSYAELKPFIKPEGLLGQFIR